MIIRLLVQPIREHDRDGKLVAAGVEWVEKRMWLFTLSLPIMVPAFFIWLGGTVKSLSNHATEASVMAAVLGGLVFFGGMWFLTDGVPRKRSVLFRADGSIETPQGLPTISWFVLKHTGFIGHRQIGSIEVGQDPEHGIDVRIYSTEGDKIVVGRHFFEPDFAHKIAVMLQKALHDIRRGYSDASQGEFDEQFAEANRRVREAMAHARPGDTVNITID